MNGNELLDCMDLVDPAFVEAADQMPEKKRIPKGLLASAACLTLLLVGTALGLRPAPVELPLETTQPTIPTVPATEPDQTINPAIIITEPDWIPHYNSEEDSGIVSDHKIHAPCYFTEPLSEEFLKRLTPEICPDWLELSGYAAFLGAAGMEGEPKLLGAFLTLTTELPAAEFSLQIKKYDYIDCVIRGYEPIVTELHGREYAFYLLRTSDGLTHLKAETIRDGWTWRYILSLPSEQEAEGKAALEQTVLAMHPISNPEFLTPSYLPEYRDEELTLEQALADPDFGSCFLPQLPAGFDPETIVRYKDYQSDYLFGLWSRGYDDIAWRVSRITDEDCARLTNLEDVENYDLSLYPIPRADSVPDELREIVDNPIFTGVELTLEAVKARAYRVQDSGDTDGWRMHFSVLYGVTLVEITAKGVEPEWIWQILSDLNESL